MTFVVPLHQIWSSALCYVSAAISDISIIPENNLMYRHTLTGFRYVRSRTICQVEKTKVLDPESNTGAANYALAVLDQLNYVTCFSIRHY